MRFSVCILLMLLASGCHSARSGRAVSKELSGSDPNAQINFWQSLTSEPVASNDQGFRALLLFVDGKDDSADYAARVATLKSRKMIPADFDESGEAALRRGTLAVAVMRVLNQRGGVTTHVLGPHPRYAVRELMFLGVFPPSTPNQVSSGNELVGIIGAMEDFQRASAGEAPAAAMPGEAR